MKALFVISLLLALRCITIAAEQQTHVDETFRAALADSAPTQVRAWVTPDQKILVAGDFRSVNGVPCRSLVRLNSDGSLDTSFRTDHISNVADLKIAADGKLLIRGDQGMRRLHADGRTDESFPPAWLGLFEPDPNGTALAIYCRPMPKWFECDTLARLDADGRTIATFQPFLMPYTFAIQPDRKILIGGGSFRDDGDRRTLERLYPGGAPDETFQASDQSDGIVRLIALQADGKILVGGNFTKIANTPRRDLARLHSNGAIDESFNGQMETWLEYFGSPPGIVSIVPAQNGFLYIALAKGLGFGGGESTTEVNVYRLFPDGRRDSSFSPLPIILQPQETFSCALQADGKLVVSGLASHRRPQVGVARLNVDGALDETFRPRLTSETHTTALAPRPGGGVMASSINSIAAITADGTADPSFLKPIFTDGWVLSILPQNDGRILVSGSFLQVNGQARSKLARLETNGRSIQLLFQIWRLTPTPGQPPSRATVQFSSRR